MKATNKSLLYAFMLIIFLFQSCAPQAVHPPLSGKDECPPPPPDVFLAAGVDLKFAQVTFRKLVLGNINIKTHPQVITLASKAAIDDRIRAYIRCLALKDGFNETQVAYFDTLSFFSKTKPTSVEFIEWQKISPFPDGKPKKTNDIGRNNLLKNGGFEQDLEYWGTGEYETNVYKGSLPKFWAGWITYYSLHPTKIKNYFIMKKKYVRVTDVTGGIDSEIRKSGNKSFKITMNQPVEGHMFGTMSQRITGLVKNTKYIVRFWVKAERAGKGTLAITTDQEWKERKQIDKGTYPWQEFKHPFNIGDKTYVDFRIISTEPGTVWVDDISFKRYFPDDKESD